MTLNENDSHYQKKMILILALDTDPVSSKISLDTDPVSSKISLNTTPVSSENLQYTALNSPKIFLHC